jgi:phenylacetate-CoA ligase
MVVRGINIYPSSIEAIVREFEVDEVRIIRTKHRAMEEVHLEIEAATSVAPALSEALSQRLAVRIPATIVPAGTLPRFNLKAKRIVDRRKS